LSGKHLQSSGNLFPAIYFQSFRNHFDQ